MELARVRNETYDEINNETCMASVAAVLVSLENVPASAVLMVRFGLHRQAQTFSCDNDA